MRTDNSPYNFLSVLGFNIPGMCNQLLDNTSRTGRGVLPVRYGTIACKDSARGEGTVKPEIIVDLARALELPLLVRSIVFFLFPCLK